ncbi:hypothetical protein P154DRAFT_578863 [Amniculicola lignicola CBS 123094]|uniref:Fungal N-terminal domain-containing protein n=1 Tax=Amniculicola lignicola CBS 123094 TaxID=1392246 RepID=A0A6A5W6N6_9PLEO|nr:hypothetical protein P154DRAFT_578863 [Amniculicola lignicola CBS 123094]
MSDPGTAVGVVSLGLQVLQGLTTYYSQFKSFSTEISAVVGRIENLHLILSALDIPVRKLERDEPISAAVRQCIDNCQAGINDLEAYRRKCGEVPLPSTQKEDRMRLIANKLLFPFRKNSLEDLGKILDRLQLSLDTIIHALQLDTTILHNEQAKKRSNVINSRLDLVLHRQSQQIELIHGVATTSQSQLHQHMSDNNRVGGVLEGLSAQFHDFERRQSEVAQQLEAMRQLGEPFMSEKYLPQMLTFWITVNAPTNEAGGQGKITPFQAWLSVRLFRSFETPEFDYVIAFFDIGCTWSLGKLLRHVNEMGVTPPACTLETLRRICTLDPDGCELAKFPILQSILSRSLTGLDISLGALQDSARLETLDPMLLTQLQMLTEWPQGLEVFLSQREKTHMIQTYRGKMLEYACARGSSKAIYLLLQTNCPVSISAWDSVVRFNTSCQAEILAVLNSIDRQTKSRPTSNVTIQHIQNVYHAWGLSVSKAEILYRAGLVEIDRIATTEKSVTFGWEYISGTPLWTHTISMLRGISDRREILDLISWFVAKGARLEAMDPFDQICPAQLLAEDLAMNMIIWQSSVGRLKKTSRTKMLTDFVREQLEFRSLYHMVFESKVVDQCNCACSSNGCNIIVSAFKASVTVCKGWNLQPYQRLQTVLKWVGVNTDFDRSTRSSIIRFLTFERLHLTHTCHSLRLHHLTRLFWGEDSAFHLGEGPPKIADIQYIEQSDLLLLEELIQEFEKAMEDYTGTIWEFIDKRWEPRMEEVIREQCTDSENGEAMLAKLGVVLRPTFGPPPVPTLLPIWYGNFDWETFQEKMAGIMDEV